MTTSPSAEPRHHLLAEEFRDRIAAEVWAVGAKIPSESELCQEFGTSRGPVRQALQALRAEGLVTGGRGRPPVVRGTVPSQPFETFMSFTEWAHGIGRTPGQRTIEVSLRAPGAAAAAALHLDGDEKVVNVLRVRSLDGAPAMVERASFVQDVGRHLFEFDADSGSIFAFLKARGADLHGAQHTIDAVLADDVDSTLLGCAMGAALLRERRVTVTREVLPIEYSDDRYLPQLTSFTINNTVDSRARLARVPSSE
ncbi:GntR family transcriptional regulator [Sinomonas notoginsengisoli]|uniref:GntR family transcriptional regulator n=1 Tax=Sinomonas notoginsengisoli TaxID=1457311 RepID=UPI001F22C9B0|nr:GntR family transcriptional regulator [Sinomonas notoginsengisoli]